MEEEGSGRRAEGGGVTEKEERKGCGRGGEGGRC